MKNSLTYSVVERKDPKFPDNPGKYYAQAQARGEAGIREISERIQKECTVTRADVMAVLTALEGIVAEALSNGEIVRLGDLGSLQVSIGSTGAETKEEFNDSMINKRKILFRSGIGLQDMLATLSYERVLSKKEQKEGQTGTDNQEPGEEEGGGGL